ncbi:N-6 DNA methylase [Listeria seeligeri]|uniref:N-6 DNA methylase n=1 Tax=Listeria seeligeri TaxID=1640 RepID=UPI0010AF8A96|nr:N-6 DNA methylase [Listeria seeligeri]ELV4714331.1 SAM-dependent DNA methyltransferase [Listeria monocytogenes]
MALTTDIINNLLNVKESYQASDALMKMLFDKKAREKVFLEFLKYDTHLERDWFHVYFEEEHANKKKYAQDFTPNSISEMIARLSDGIDDKKGGTRMDIAAGTGSLTIRKWHNDCLNHSPFEYKPSMYLYQCEELSDRALPFLLFNLMIRGANATVVHGDSLSREAKQVYFIQNDEDDLLKFSSLNIMPHSKTVEREFDIRKWIEPVIEHIESPLTVADRYLNALEIEEETGQLKLF